MNVLTGVFACGEFGLENKADNGDAVAIASSRPQNRRLAFNEIDLIEVARDVWGAKYFTAFLAVLGILFAILSLTFARPIYTATVTIGPSEDSGTHAGGGLGQYAAAAGALGITLGDADGSYFNKYKELLDSNLLSENLFRRDDLRTLLFGPGWNAKTKTFKRPVGLVFAIKEFIKGILGLHRWSQPGPFELRELLKRQMVITTDKVTGFVQISMQSDTPRQAVYLLHAVIAEADSQLRESAKRRATGRIEYLTRTLDHTAVQDQREATIDILSAQQKNLMMASVDKTFAMEIIDPPAAPTIPTSPKPRATLVMDLLVTVLAGLFAAIAYGQKMRWSTKDRRAPLKNFDAVVWDFICGLREGRAFVRRFGAKIFKHS